MRRICFFSALRAACRGARSDWIQKTFHARDQILRLERFADEFVGFHLHGFFRYGAIHYAGHQDHRSFSEAFVFFYELADFVAVFIGHDHVGDDGVGSGVAELGEG